MGSRALPLEPPLGVDVDGGVGGDPRAGLHEEGATSDCVAEICRRYGNARLLVFGSAARGTVTATSDVDMLYELAPGRHLGWEIEDPADELSQVMGRRVDLVSLTALHHRLRDAVLAETRPLYAA